MKLLFHLLFFVLLFFTVSCRTQMVQTIADAQKLEINEKQFVGKSLRHLLKEIKPDIKMVSITPGWAEQASYFVFRFQTREEFSKNISKGRDPTSIRVYTKEFIPWDAVDRPKKDWWKWTENDVKKYGNLTVKAILVGGEN